jgi:hypothetical protein
MATRLAIREMSGTFYLLSSSIVLVILAFIGLVNKDNDSATGVLYNEYTVLDAEMLMGIIVSAGWLAATIICGSAFFKDFKEEARGVRYFSLPLSNTERFASLLLVNWGFVSIITFGPPLLLVAISWFVLPDFILFPAPQYLLPVLFIGPLLHLISCCYWMFSSIAYPKLSALFIFGFIGLSALYITQTRDLYSERVDIEHRTAAFDATDVVGMMEHGFLSQELVPSTVQYYNSEWETPIILLTGTCLLFMLVSAAMALKRKTT